MNYFAMNFLKLFVIFWSFIIILFQSQFINNVLPFFWRYISFFKYFFIVHIHNCLWVLSLFFFFLTFIILLAIFLQIKSSAAPAVFWMVFFEEVLIAFVADCLVRSKSFWRYLRLKCLLIFLPIFLTKNINR